MSDGISVETDGNSFNRIINILESQPQKAQYRIQRMLQTSADRILVQATKAAPEDTGALKESGHIEPVVTDADAEHIAFDVVFGDGSATEKSYDYGDVEADGYSFFVELGTVKMPPRPFLGPAFEEESQKIVTRLGNIFSTDDDS